MLFAVIDIGCERDDLLLWGWVAKHTTHDLLSLILGKCMLPSVNTVRKIYVLKMISLPFLHKRRNVIGVRTIQRAVTLKDCLILVVYLLSMVW